MELHGRCELNYPPDGADHQIVFVVHSGDE
jgi:hypothetical protein